MSRRDLERAFNALARAVTASSPVTAAPATSTVRAVIVDTAPLLARVGIAETATPVTNSVPGYTPVVDDVVVVARVGRRQFITGKTEEKPCCLANMTWVCTAGDSYAWRIQLWDDADQTEETDLTGVTVAAEIRDKSAGTQIVELDCEVTLPNIVDVTMTPAMYADCPAKGVWDLQLTYTGGDVHTVLRGAVTVTPDVTESTP